MTLSFGIGAMILATGHAFGQSAEQGARNCGQREMVLQRLASRYGESRQSIGLGSNNQVVEVFASLETGTWTITVTHRPALPRRIGPVFRDSIGSRGASRRTSALRSDHRCAKAPNR